MSDRQRFEVINCKSLKWKDIILPVLVVALGSFDIGLFVLTNQPHHQAATKYPVPLSAKATTHQHAAASKGAMANKDKTVAKADSVIFSVPQQLEAKTIKQVKLSGSEPVIALTFDDGPWPKATQQILDILKQENVKATFFWVGKMVQSYPQVAKLVVADGHAIGNHTWSHSYWRMNSSIAAREIESTAAIIHKTTGVKTSLFRPPGGVLNNGVANYAKKKNYAVIMWSDDSKDYCLRCASRGTRLVNDVLKQAKPGGIVLMHDGGGNRSHTIEALPQIIAGLRALGYRFVTVPELLEMQAKELPINYPDLLR